MSLILKIDTNVVWIQAKISPNKKKKKLIDKLN